MLFEDQKGRAYDRELPAFLRRAGAANGAEGKGSHAFAEEQRFSSPKKDWLKAIIYAPFISMASYGFYYLRQQKNAQSNRFDLRVLEPRLGQCIEMTLG